MIKLVISGSQTKEQLALGRKKMNKYVLIKSITLGMFQNASNKKITLLKNKTEKTFSL